LSAARVALRRLLASTLRAVTSSHGSGSAVGTRSSRRQAVANVSAATSSAAAGPLRRAAKRTAAA
jgi:hypothetical protein